MLIPGIWTGMYAELPLHEALRTLYECGWMAFEASTEHLEQIETDDEPDARIEETQECLGRLGLSMPQAHALIRANVADPDEEKRQLDIKRLQRHFEIAARLGVKNVVIHPGGAQGYTTRAERKRSTAHNVEAFRRLGDLAGELGLRIGIENMMRRETATPYGLLDLLDAIDHPAIGITLDTSHANVVGLDIPATVREFGPRLVATHISDNDGSGDQHRTPGNGHINWVQVMRAFQTAGYDGLFNLEIPGERHPVPALRALKCRFALEVTEWLLALNR